MIRLTSAGMLLLGLCLNLPAAPPTVSDEKLLADPKPAVRLRAALARLDSHDPAAVPVLVALLGELLQEEGRTALEALRQLAGPLAPTVELPADDAGRKRCRDAWEAWWKEVDGPLLLAHFRKATPTVDLDRVGELVKKLGHRSFAVREQATEEMILLRGLALPYLEKVLEDPDIELRRRAERCVEAIRAAPDAARSSAYVRLLSLRRPQGALAALLAYVAFADDESVVEDVRQAMRIVARRDPQAAKVLRGALDDKVPLRRGLAAEALAEIDWPGAKDRLAELLKDDDPRVRWRTATALAHREDGRSLPVLIDLLEILRPESAWQVEDLLRRVAGEKAPPDNAGSDGAQRKKARTAWLDWYKEHGTTADLSRAKTGDEALGYTLVSQWNTTLQVNEIVELGRDKKPRWKIENLGFAFDFEVLPGSRLLCAEHNQHRVTERNFKGEVLWEYKINGPINVQRLPGGHTFVAAMNAVVIVDRAGKELVRNDKLGSIMMGQRTPNGQMLIVLSDGNVVRLDAKGNEVKRFSLGGGVNNYGGAHALPDGRLLVAMHNRNMVLELDADGKQVWKAEVHSPNFATRLPNGNTLVGSQDARTLWELDRQGIARWEYKPDMGIWRARRR